MTVDLLTKSDEDYTTGGDNFSKDFIFISGPVDSLLKFLWGAFCDSLFSIWFFFFFFQCPEGLEIITEL